MDTTHTVGAVILAAVLLMPLDISPLCLYHDLPMIPTQETRHPRRFLEEMYYWFSAAIADAVPKP